jgi:hypothetical protein
MENMMEAILVALLSIGILFLGGVSFECFTGNIDNCKFLAMFGTVFYPFVGLLVVTWLDHVYEYGGSVRLPWVVGFFVFYILIALALYRCLSMDCTISCQVGGGVWGIVLLSMASLPLIGLVAQFFER